MARKDELTEKQEDFCRFYIEQKGNASEAYRMAYDAKNSSESTINKEAIKLRDNPKITRRINELREERRKETEPDRKAVEAVLMDIIKAGPKDLYLTDRKTGKMKLRTPSQLSEKANNAMKKMVNKKGEVTYEFYGKTEAARILASMNGWDAPKQIAVTGGDGTPMKELRIGFDDDE